MGDAKLLRVEPITSAAARALVTRLHYSGKYVNNSQLHIGVRYHNKLEGVIQLGPPMDRSHVLPLVKDTPWNGMLEINRMAFSNVLPRNSESRALGVVLRLLRQKKPNLKWILSFSDATQCGDGTIYRAAGFKLIGINKNKAVCMTPDGKAYVTISLRPGTAVRAQLLRKHKVTDTGQAPATVLKQIGAKMIPGFQLRYIYFLDAAWQANLTVPVLPFAAIAEAGAGMYLGRKRVTEKPT